MIISSRSAQPAEPFQWRVVVSEGVKDQLIFSTSLSVCFQFKGTTIQRPSSFKSGVTEATLAVTSLKSCSKEHKRVVQSQSIQRRCEKMNKGRKLRQIGTDVCRHSSQEQMRKTGGQEGGVRDKEPVRTEKGTEMDQTGNQSSCLSASSLHPADHLPKAN